MAIHSSSSQPCTKVLLLLLMFLVIRAWTTPVGTSAGLQRFSRAHFQFSLDVYTKLAQENPPSADGEAPNILFSPYSLSTVLAMIFLGAGSGSNTALQLRTSLHLSNFSFSEVHASFKTVLNNLADPYYKEALTVANGIFHQNGFAISETYRRALEEYYAAELQDVDFSGDPTQTMQHINTWVSNQTDGKIPQLLSHPLSSDMRLLLVNALSFKSQWLYKFDSSMTFDKGLFYTTAKKRYEIPMMVGRFKIPVGYSHDLECRIAELPFASKRVSLFIILPDDVEGLARLESNMTSDIVKTVFSTLKDEVINIRLPRFKLEQDTRLIEALSAMGITDVFDKEASDLSGISSTEKLFVDSVIHKTYLEINEEGVEAAATTATGLNRIGAFGEKYFEVDHPFMFFLWDYHSGILLFLGRVTAPEPWIA